MDVMDIDQVVEVPDTPDRLASQNINGKNCIRRERYVSSMTNLIENADTSAAGLQGVPRNNKRATKSESRSMFIPPRHDSTKTELQGNFININSGNALASRGAFSSRRTAIDHTFNDRGKSNFHPEYMGKGKALSNPNSEMAGCQGHVKVLDLTDEDDHLRTYQKFVTGSSQSKEHRKEMADKRVSPLPILEDSHVGKINDNPRTSHRTSCQKKLVRNGCISPLNVAKAKLTAQRQDNTFLHSHQDDSGTSRDSMAEVKDTCRVERNGCVSPFNVSKAKQPAQTQNNTFLHPYQDDYGSSREPTAEDKHSHRVKGKGLLTHSGLLMESEAKARPLPGRILAGKVDGASHANKAACVRSEGSSGWISTREHTRRPNISLSDEEPLLYRRTDDPCNVNKLPRTVVARRDTKEGNITRKHSVSSQNASAAPITQTVSQKHQGGRLNDHPDSSNTVIKRQRQGSSRSHQGESSSSARSNSEMVVLGSSGEPSNARSIRTQNSHAARSFKPIIDIDEFSPEIRSNGRPCNIDRSSASVSDIRDRQLEADEILARELQEQLYNESNVAADREIDEHVALALQQEISQHAFASRSQHVPHPRSSSISNSHRENMLRSSQNSSTQRVTQPRGPTSNRIARLRSRFPGQPRTISSRQRNVVFPPNMDVDMRMHILEALEAFNDMGMAGSLLQAQRDFNENDYEMLLALDENNHQHGGASAAQINALPESTVQTDNLEECSICLETPSIGDTIRHLPCLHKFHKDCIDEWVRRRTTCPICKSSVT